MIVIKVTVILNIIIVIIIIIIVIIVIIIIKLIIIIPIVKFTDLSLSKTTFLFKFKTLNCCEKEIPQIKREKKPTLKKKFVEFGLGPYS